jgi:DNA-binding transcriptional LysR family regulator
VPTPQGRITCFTVTLRMRLLADGPYLSVFSASVMRANSALFGVGSVPVALGTPAWPVVAVTLRDRTPNPVVAPFVDSIRSYAAARLG